MNSCGQVKGQRHCPVVGEGHDEEPGLDTLSENFVSGHVGRESERKEGGWHGPDQDVRNNGEAPQEAIGGPEYKVATMAQDGQEQRREDSVGDGN